MKGIIHRFVVRALQLNPEVREMNQCPFGVVPLAKSRHLGQSMGHVPNSQKKGLLGVMLLVVVAAIFAACFLFSKAKERQAKSVVSAHPSAREQLSAGIRALRSNPDSSGSQVHLDELRRALTAVPARARALVIQRLLDAKEDAPTGVGFTVGKDGFLQEPSSVRVFLLDELGKADPSVAAAYAEKILASKDSPDEWAVSLRNYALGSTSEHARAFLQQKFREMVRYEAWQKEPSTGFLEAFDVAVHLGGTELLPDLTELFRQKDNQALAHAAFLALDRLVIREPVTVLEQVQNNPDWMSGREVTRANYFARLNVEDDQQRSVLEKYLLDPRRSAAELETFAGLFPNANFMVSHNLLTKVSTVPGDVLRQRDRVALQTVDRWLSDPRFESRRPQLAAMRRRVAQFASSAE